MNNVQKIISFKMGCQKKVTVHTYDSNSGHAYYIDSQNDKVVIMIVYSKKYTMIKESFYFT